MATYKITSPDGQAYNVNAPDDASQDEVLAYAQRSFKMAATPKPETTPFRDLMQGAGNLAAGAVRGAGSIGATIMRPFETGSENEQRRQSMDAALQSFGAKPDSWMYKGGKLAGEIAGTAGAGGVLANGARAVPFLAKAAPVIDAIGSSGMTAGGLAGARGVAARAAGSAIAGGAQAAMVDPNDALMGAGIGAVTPGVLQLAGKFGSTVYNAVKGNKAGAGKMLANAMGVSESELPAIIKALENAPDSIVDGSRLTVNQALQTQGAATPGSRLLERVVSGGVGGDPLLKRYAEQQAARMAALEAQGAITDTAASEIKTATGDKLGAILRTQAADDGKRARVLWKGPNEDELGGVYGQAAKDNVMLNLPLDRMQAAISPLGRGSVLQAKDARSVLGMANEIGTMELPEITALKQGKAINSQSLEQAVRSAGGIRGGSGELRDLGIKQSGTTGLINNKTGQQADILAEEMYRRGFIPDADPATLFDALRNGGGRKLYANDAVENNGLQRMLEGGMGDMPAAERIPVPVPFGEFQRLRRDSGELAAKIGDRGGVTESGVLNKFNQLLTQRADDAANGLTMTGDNISPEFLDQYNRARALTRQNAELYKGGNNISQILRKPFGQDFTLTGDEITNKLWHGGSGLAGDVSNFKNVLNGNNYNPSMDALRKFIMTDAAGKTTASGDLAAALPRYVETRMPGLLEAMNPDQLKALTGVASDIRNQDAASNVKGLLGSDTQAKISRALDAGLLESPTVKRMAGLLSLKGFGAESLRDTAAESIVKYKGKTIANLMANPKDAAKALADSSFVQRLDGDSLKALRLVVSRSAPVLAAD